MIVWILYKSESLLESIESEPEYNIVLMWFDLWFNMMQGSHLDERP